MLGAILSTIFKSGDYSRNDCIIATKVGRYDGSVDFSGARTLQSVEESLERLQTDHIELIQTHDIEFAPNLDIIIQETLPALHEAKAAGKVGHVGITGLSLPVLDYVIHHTDVPIETVLTYCCYTLQNTELLTYLPSWKHKQIGVIQGGAMAMGLLTPQGPQDWHPAPEIIKSTCRDAVEICEELGEDIVRLAFQYTFQQPDIATCLMGATSSQSIAQNFDWLNQPLNEDAAATVQDALAPIRNKLWVEEGSEHNIARATSRFWASGKV